MQGAKKGPIREGGGLGRLEPPSGAGLLLRETYRSSCSTRPLLPYYRANERDNKAETKKSNRSEREVRHVRWFSAGVLW